MSRSWLLGCKVRFRFVLEFCTWCIDKWTGLHLLWLIRIMSFLSGFVSSWFLWWFLFFNHNITISPWLLAPISCWRSQPRSNNKQGAWNNPGCRTFRLNRGGSQLNFNHIVDSLWDATLFWPNQVRVASLFRLRSFLFLTWVCERLTSPRASLRVVVDYSLLQPNFSHFVVFKVLVLRMIFHYLFFFMQFDVFSLY